MSLAGLSVELPMILLMQRSGRGKVLMGNSEHGYQEQLLFMIKRDSLRVKALDCVWQLGLPQCYLAAGFVRNLVWDHLHQKEYPTALNDLDVVYFDPTEECDVAYLDFESRLRKMMPEVNWQVRNQAKMHSRNGDIPYTSTLDALSYWPEKETAVGIRKINRHDYELIAAFGWDSLFNLHLTANPKRSHALFAQRVRDKRWLTLWPKLQIVESMP